MNKCKLLIFIFLNYMHNIYSYSLGIGSGSLNNIGKSKGSDICILNYNNVYSSLYKWSKENTNSHKKLINDTLWINKNRFIHQNIIIGIYNDVGILTYMCQLRKVENMRFILVNIFANPSNKLEEDSFLFDNLYSFCEYNKYSLDTRKLKIIDNSKYYLTYIFEKK